MLDVWLMVDEIGMGVPRAVEAHDPEALRAALDNWAEIHLMDDPEAVLESLDEAARSGILPRWAGEYLGFRLVTGLTPQTFVEMVCDLVEADWEMDPVVEEEPEDEQVAVPTFRVGDLRLSYDDQAVIVRILDEAPRRLDGARELDELLRALFEKRGK